VLSYLTDILLAEFRVPIAGVILIDACVDPEECWQARTNAVGTLLMLHSRGYLSDHKYQGILHSCHDFYSDRCLAALHSGDN
jgi:hypothetical protein